MLTKGRCLYERVSRSGLFLICFLLAANAQVSFAAQDVIDYVPSPAGQSGIIVDSRPAGQCEKGSLKGANCLPARDLLGPHKRLANFSGLLWLLGTAGLTGEEHVLVVGDQSSTKEFLAGVLYLAGQRKISVLAAPLKSLPDDKIAPGTSRSKTRESVYQAPMRSDRIVLRSELIKLLRSGSAPVLLDGRSEVEYWGQEIRGPRGGHLPGAQHLPATSVRPAKKGPPPVHLGSSEYAIAYGHGSYESIVFLARLVASGVQAKVLLEGWAGWAANGVLPADSVTYPDPRASRQPAILRTQTDSKFGLPFIALIILGGLGLFAAGFFASRKLSR